MIWLREKRDSFTQNFLFPILQNSPFNAARFSEETARLVTD